MLSAHAALPVLAVTDMDKARSFYEGTLGFSSVGDMPEGVVYRTSNGGFLVYPSSFAGTNKATAITFQVPGDAFDAEIDALRTAGVTFQTFDMPGDATWTDGVLSDADGSMRSVWFADPDGNILNVETDASVATG
ncbi:VOC family protein [Cellulomonas sp. ICMP 17802]|uniref:VOC family protein n=1 Tax=Cellulomonas sp. ICMP 17802 TaxID=3239199 RepID=UPI00351B4CC2